MLGAGVKLDPVLHHTGDSHRPEPEAPVGAITASRHQPLDARLRQHGGEKLRRDRPVQQAISVLGEHRRVPHWILDAEPDKPAKQKISVEPLHQLSLGGAHGVSRLGVLTAVSFGVNTRVIRNFVEGRFELP